MKRKDREEELRRASENFRAKLEEVKIKLEKKKAGSRNYGGTCDT